MRDAALVVGLVLGAVLLLSVCYVFVTQRSFGTGGALLSFLGVVLVGLSVWTNAQIKISREGIEARFEQIQRVVQQVTEANQVLSEELGKVASRAETTDRQFVDLTQDLQNQSALPALRAEAIRRSIATQPTLDPKRLSAIVEAIDIQSLKTLQK